MFSKLIFIFLFISLINFNFFVVLANSSLNDDTPFNETIQNKIKLYLPEYQNKYIRINELNNTNFNFSKIINKRNALLISDNILDTYDEAYKREKISEIIDNQSILNNKININRKKFSKEYKFYGAKNNFLFDHNYVWHKFIEKNTIIYEKSTSIINEIITTEPEQLIINAPICSIQKFIFYIKNPDKEINLIIKDVRTDIYQAQIFSYTPPSEKMKSNKFNLSRIIPPKKTYALEIYVIIDYHKPILGTLYIEFNDKKVLLIPIKITGRENKYGVNPIYQTDVQIKKFLHIPIKVFNPSKKVLIIKKVLHPFKKINVLWPNRSSVISNSNLPSSSMFQIQPNSSKIIMYLKFYSATPSSEYGIIQIMTLDSSINIPILFNSISSPIITYPKIFNFGLCQISSKNKYNIKKIIPLNLSNKGSENIKIGKVYLEYDNLFVQFHQNFNGNNVIITPNEEIKYGFLIFDANLVSDFDIAKHKLVGKLQKGSIYIETNSTDCPFLQVNYTFMPDMNKIEKVISGDVQILPKHKNKYNFEIKLKYKAPYGLEKMSQYKLGQNMTLLYEKYVEVKTLNPKNEDQACNVNIIFELERVDIFHWKRFFYIPLFLTYSLYSYIPVQLDNNDINIVYCGTEENSTSLDSCLKTFGTSNMLENLKNESHKMQNFNFSFNSSLYNIKKQKFFFLINENSSPIRIDKIFTNNEMFVIGFDNIEYVGNDISPQYDKSKLKNLEFYVSKNLKIKNKANKYTTAIILEPYTAIKFSINLKPSIDDNISIKGKNTIIYNNNSRFVIDNTAQIIKGSFDIIQTNIKFEPSFPGLVQSIDIYCQNSLEIPISLYNASSSDERIVASLLTYNVSSNNKTKFLRIDYEPGNDNLLWQYLNQVNFKNTLTFREVYFWKEREKYFNKLRQQGKTEVNANITIDTSVGKKVINVNSDLIMPAIMKNSGITFGLVQVGKSLSGYFEIYNPSDQVVAIKLLLAPNEYYDINDNNMLPEKERELLKMNDDVFLFGCNFLGKIENESTYIKNFEYIIIPEKIDMYELKKDSIDKKEIIKLIYKYGNSRVRDYLNHGHEVFCKYKKRDKNEMIINYSKTEVVSNLFSPDFEKEIEIIRNLTDKNYLEEEKTMEVKKENLWEKVYSFFVNLYIKYYLHVSINTEIKKPEVKQNFYISSELVNQMFIVQPKKKGKLGPIIFKPNKWGNISETLLLKNNLTFIHSVKLLGVGGGAEPSFFPNHQKNSIDNSQIFNKTNYIIEIDEHTFNTELKSKGKITKTITIKNTGNIAMNVKNITIDGYKCDTDDFKILQCEEFTLSPDENLDIDMEIKPNINNYITNKNIYFNTDFQVFNLNVIIIISKDIYIQNNLVKNKIIPFIILLLICIILFGIGKGVYKIFLLYKSKIVDKLIKKKIEKLIQESEKEPNSKDENEIYKNDKADNEQQIKEEENNKNLSKNKKKKNKKKNKTKSNEINRKESNTEKSEKNENFEIEKKETPKEEIKKEPEKKEEDYYNYKEFKLYSPTTKKTSKQKSLNKQKDEEKEKNRKITTEEKSNETDSLNGFKSNNSNNITNESAEKSKKYYKNFNYNNNNSRWNDKYKPKYSGSRKSFYNTFNTYNTYNNYNNYNEYNDYHIPEDKKQGTAIKLSMNKNVNNLYDLFKEEPKKEKKLKKKNEKEKELTEIDDKLKYYYPLNNNTKDKMNEMNNPTFLNDEKSNKEFSFEQELIKNIDKNDSTKNENNSIFNFDNFILNDEMNSSKINNKEEYESNEDINEGEEEMKDFFINKSLMDNIENPYLDDEKDEKSRFFKYNFFNDKKDDN